MTNTIQFEMEAKGNESLTLAHSGEQDFKEYTSKLNATCNALNQFKERHDEELNDLNLVFDLTMAKIGFSTIEGNISSAINKLPKYARMEASTYYSKVLRELSGKFHIPNLNQPLNDVPRGLEYVIDNIEYNGNFKPKQINAVLFDRYIDASIHSDLVIFIEAQNRLCDKLGKNFTKLSNILVIGMQGLDFNQKMDVSNISKFSKYI